MIHAHLKITDLWEMLRINAPAYAALMAEVSMLIIHLRNILPSSMNEQLWQEIKTDVIKISAHLGVLDLEFSQLKAKSIIKDVEEYESSNPGNHDFILSDLRELNIRIHDELQKKVIYYVGSDAEEYILEGAKKFPVVVRKAFVDAYDDLEEASKCFGLERYTACVFHLMRAMEQALRDVGAEINQDGKYRTWQQIEESLKNVVDAEVLIQIGRVRSHWRNSTMHPSRDHYSKDQVKKIFPAVQTLLEQLAEYKKQESN